MTMGSTLRVCTDQPISPSISVTPAPRETRTSSILSAPEGGCPSPERLARGVAPLVSEREVASASIDLGLGTGDFFGAPGRIRTCAPGSGGRRSIP